MEWSNASLLIVCFIANLGAIALEEIGKSLFALLLIVGIVGSLSAFGLTALGWRWIKHATAELHAPRHRPAH